MTIYDYDLHVHTNASDGLFTPSQVIEKAIKAEVKGIAITDHDSIEGLKEAIDYANIRYPEFIVVPGIEFNTNQDEESIHVLGYYMDYQSEIFTIKLEQLQSWREERAKKIIEKLNGLGYKIEYSEVKKRAKNSVGRPHIARILLEKKLVSTEKWAFEHLLIRGKPAYVPRHPFTPKNAADLIHSCGGVAVLAHPGLIHNQKLVEDFFSSEARFFDGIEVFYPSHKLYQIKKYLMLAKQENLIITGGSDFHGKATAEHATCIGFCGLNDEKQMSFYNKICALKKRLDL